MAVAAGSAWRVGLKSNTAAQSVGVHCQMERTSDTDFEHFEGVTLMIRNNVISSLATAHWIPRVPAPRVRRVPVRRVYTMV